jgi:dienelactone hydrolase
LLQYNTTNHVVVAADSYDEGEDVNDDEDEREETEKEYTTRMRQSKRAAMAPAPSQERGASTKKRKQPGTLSPQRTYNSAHGLL